jgi:hypothetical protein
MKCDALLNFTNYAFSDGRVRDGHAIDHAMLFENSTFDIL